MACIAGAIAATCYKYMPPETCSAIFDYLPEHLVQIALQFRDRDCRYDDLPSPVDCL